MNVIDIDRLESEREEARERLASAPSYPHIVLENFLDREACEALLKEFIESEDDPDWTQYVHYNERKQGFTNADRMGPRTREIIAELSSPRFCRWLSSIAGVDALIADPDLDGGGLHKIETGGYLNLHVDYLSHTLHRNWSRQINLLVFLNHDWRPEYNGALELWNHDMTQQLEKIEPEFNRCVIFRTVEGSFHGHPMPLRCPEGVGRRSLALYYFREEEKPLRLSPTNYRARPDEPILTHAKVAADRTALRAYSFMKRYLGLSDRHLSRVIRALRRED